MGIVFVSGETNSFWNLERTVDAERLRVMILHIQVEERVKSLLNGKCQEMAVWISLCTITANA